ncbi:MAG: outer membrane lipoprotein-sorting protein [Gammaproteobacteria bacterium]|nr:outer membrane lipoprotein-sorting protein [Gammaproteobacteria bacterium]
MILRYPLTICAAVLAVGAWGEASVPPDGREIAERMDKADTSVDGERLATMLIERRGQRLVRELSMRVKKFGDDERTLIRFIEPADVRDTQYLSWTYDAIDQDDDMWVFFPTENLVRRISGGGKKGSFMRSDFANEDIEQRAVDDDEHTFIEETTLDDRPAYVIESRPIPAKAKDSSYAKRRIWVDAERWLPLRIEYYDRRDRLLKILSQGGIEEIDGIWTATKLIMETPRRDSRTLMQYADIRYDIGLPDSAFEQTALRR